MEFLRKVELVYFLFLNTLPMYIVIKCWNPLDDDILMFVAGVLLLGGFIRMCMLMSPDDR